MNETNNFKDTTTSPVMNMGNRQPDVEISGSGDWGEFKAYAWKVPVTWCNHPEYVIKFESRIHPINAEMVQIILESMTHHVSPVERKMDLWHNQDPTGIKNPVPMSNFIPEFESAYVLRFVIAPPNGGYPESPEEFSSMFKKFLAGWFERVLFRIETYLRRLNKLNTPCVEIRDNLSNLHREGITHDPFETCGNTIPKISQYNYKDMLCVCLIQVCSHYKFNLSINDNSIINGYSEVSGIPYDKVVSNIIGSAMRNAIAYCQNLGDYDNIKALISYSIDPYDYAVELGIRSGAPCIPKNSFYELSISNTVDSAYMTDHEPLVKMIFDIFADNIIDSFSEYVDARLQALQEAGVEFMKDDSENDRKALKAKDDYELVWKISIPHRDITYFKHGDESELIINVRDKTMSTLMMSNIVNSFASAISDTLGANYRGDDHCVVITFRHRPEYSESGSDNIIKVLAKLTLRIIDSGSTELLKPVSESMNEKNVPNDEDGNDPDNKLIWALDDSEHGFVFKLYEDIIAYRLILHNPRVVTMEMMSLIINLFTANMKMADPKLYTMVNQGSVGQSDPNTAVFMIYKDDITIDVKLFEDYIECYATELHKDLSHVLTRD